MGTRGPPPKRESQRRRRNNPTSDELSTAPGAAEVPVPKPNAKWHPIAKRWFESLAASGQSAFYEQSDWAVAEVIAESLSRDLRPKVVGVNEKTGKVITATLPMSGASLAAYLKGMTALLVTEADRRRARLELERPGGGVEEGAADVSWLEDARRRRGAG